MFGLRKVYLGLRLLLRCFCLFGCCPFCIWWLFQRAIQAHVAEVAIDIYKEQYVWPVKHVHVRTLAVSYAHATKREVPAATRLGVVVVAVFVAVALKTKNI